MKTRGSHESPDASGAFVLRCKQQDLAGFREAAKNGADLQLEARRSKRVRMVEGDHCVIALVTSSSGTSQSGLKGIFGFADVVDVRPSSKSEDSLRLRVLLNLFTSPVPASAIRADKLLRSCDVLFGPDAYRVYDALTMPVYTSLLRLAHERLEGELAAELAETEEELRQLEIRYADAMPANKEAVSRRIERGGFAEKVKHLSGYRCVICEALGQNPIGFVSATSGHPYVEAHHVYPVGSHRAGVQAPSNVITVCANHHRQLHYGDVKVMDYFGETFTFRIDGQDIQVPKVVAAVQ